MSVIEKSDGTIILRFKDGVRIVSDKDVILMSGHERDGAPKANPSRPGYVYGVWENPALDLDGNPIMMLPFWKIEYDKDDKIIPGEMMVRKASFTPQGKLRVPAGWMAEPHFYEPCKDCE